MRRRQGPGSSGRDRGRQPVGQRRPCSHRPAVGDATARLGARRARRRSRGPWRCDRGRRAPPGRGRPGVPARPAARRRGRAAYLDRRDRSVLRARRHRGHRAVDVPRGQGTRVAHRRRDGRRDRARPPPVGQHRRRPGGGGATAARRADAGDRSAHRHLGGPAGWLRPQAEPVARRTRRRGRGRGRRAVATAARVAAGSTRRRPAEPAHRLAPRGGAGGGDAARRAVFGPRPHHDRRRLAAIAGGARRRHRFRAPDRGPAVRPDPLRARLGLATPRVSVSRRDRRRRARGRSATGPCGRCGR